MGEEFPPFDDTTRAYMGEFAYNILGLITDISPVSSLRHPAGTLIANNDGDGMFGYAPAVKFPFHAEAAGPKMWGTCIGISGVHTDPTGVTRSGKGWFLLQCRWAFPVLAGNTLHGPGDYGEIDNFIAYLDGHPWIWADKYGRKLKTRWPYRLWVHPFVQRATIGL